MNVAKQKVAYSVLGHAPSQKSDETSERGLFSWMSARSLVSQHLLVNDVECLRTCIICSFQKKKMYPAKQQIDYGVLGQALN